MADEIYSAFEIQATLVKAATDLHFALEKIEQNNKNYEYGKDIIDNYKNIAKEIAKDSKRLKELVNKMEVFDERKNGSAKKIRREDII